MNIKWKELKFIFSENSKIDDENKKKSIHLTLNLFFFLMSRMTQINFRNVEKKYYIPVTISKFLLFEKSSYKKRKGK